MSAGLGCTSHSPGVKEGNRETSSFILTVHTSQAMSASAVHPLPVLQSPLSGPLGPGVPSQDLLLYCHDTGLAGCVCRNEDPAKSGERHGLAQQSRGAPRPWSNPRELRGARLQLPALPFPREEMPFRDSAAVIRELLHSSACTSRCLLENQHSQRPSLARTVLLCPCLLKSTPSRDSHTTHPPRRL